MPSDIWFYHFLCGQNRRSSLQFWRSTHGATSVSSGGGGVTVLGQNLPGARFCFWKPGFFTLKRLTYHVKIFGVLSEFFSTKFFFRFFRPNFFQIFSTTFFFGAITLWKSTFSKKIQNKCKIWSLLFHLRQTRHPETHWRLRNPSGKSKKKLKKWPPPPKPLFRGGGVTFF